MSDRPLTWRDVAITLAPAVLLFLVLSWASLPLKHAARGTGWEGPVSYGLTGVSILLASLLAGLIEWHLRRRRG